MITKSRVENDKSTGATTVSVTLFDTRQGSQLLEDEGEKGSKREGDDWDTSS